MSLASSIQLDNQVSVWSVPCSSPAKGGDQMFTVMLINIQTLVMPALPRFNRRFANRRVTLTFFETLTAQV